MKVLRAFLPVAVAIAVALPLVVRGQGASSQPPVAAKQPKVTTIHGYTRSDDYFWMRERDNPAVRRHLEAENAYTEGVMKPTEPVQKVLYDEMVGRIKQTDESVPYRSATGSTGRARRKDGSTRTSCADPWQAGWKRACST